MAGALVCFGVSVSAAGIGNVRYYRTADDTVVIYYDLDGSGPATVTVSVLLEGANEISLTPASLTGDAGAGVLPGRNRRIVWDAGRDYGALPGSFSVTVLADSAAEAVPGGRNYGDKTVVACPLKGGIRLDGLLDEPDWLAAEPATGFIQRELIEGQPATERTEVRILYDRDNLYIGVVCHDSDPGRIIRNELRRDGRLRNDDNFAVVLDTFNDKRTGFYFRINPNGARYDGTVSVGNFWVNDEWDGLWDAAGNVGGDGWSAEMHIPFKTLRFTHSDIQNWGINFSREIPRKQEEVLWTSWGRDDGIMQLTKTGTLVGMKDIERGKQIFFKPFVMGGAEREEGVSGDKLKYGLDVKYPVTSDLTLDLTTFTDFAQVESDREEINLTRFSLYYPEKREFFLEGSDIFAFGSRFTSPFYSRRIGLSEDLEQVPILGGAKLTGKAGDYNIGVINMQTDAEGTQPATNYSVVRVRKDILERSYIGFIATNLSNADDHRSQAYGVDFAYHTGNFLGNKNLEIEAYVAENRTPGVNHGKRAGRLSISLPNDLFWGRFLYHVVGENYQPEIGYVRRDGIKQTSTHFSFRPRPDIPFVRQLRFTPLDITYYTDMKNRLLSREVGFTPLGIDFTTGDEFKIEITQSHEYLDELFNIFDDVIIPVGSYTWWNGGASFETSRSRPLSFETSFNTGECFSGRRSEFETGCTMNFSKHFSLSADMTYNSITVGDRSFDTREFGGRLNANLSTRLTSRTFVQWNNETREANLNFRIHFIPSIGSDIYIVYNHLWDGMRDYRTAYNAGMSKIAWLVTF